MKKFLYSLMLIAFLFIIGCSNEGEKAAANDQTEGDTSSEETSEVEDVNSQKESDDVATEPVEEETELEVYNDINSMTVNTEGNIETVEGSGSQSHVFNVTVDGMVKFKSNNTGSSNFMVDIENGETGEQVGMAANHIGDYEGEKFVYLDKGEYILQVNSDGNWSIDIEQPFLSKVVEGNEFSGVGDQTIGPISFDTGRIELIGTHNGESNFMVSLLRVYGQTADIAFNEIGTYEGSYITVVEPELIYYIDVMADGEWSLSIKEG